MSSLEQEESLCLIELFSIRSNEFWRLEYLILVPMIATSAW